MKTSNIFLGAIAVELGILVGAKAYKNIKRALDKKVRDSEKKFFSYTEELVADLRDGVYNEIDNLNAANEKTEEIANNVAEDAQKNTEELEKNTEEKIDGLIGIIAEILTKVSADEKNNNTESKPKE